MNAADVIGYHFDGEAYCNDCFERAMPDDDTMEAHGGVVFADDEDEYIGATCGTCQACYGPDGWSEAHCEGCNGQRPYSRDDIDARLDARQGGLKCRGCGGRERF